MSTRPESESNPWVNPGTEPVAPDAAPETPQTLRPAESEIPGQTPTWSAVSGTEFRQLDRRVIALWRLTRLIGNGVVLAVLAAAAAGISLTNPGTAIWVWPIWLVLAVVLVGLALWFPPRTFAAWGYRIDDRVLETRSGIVIRVTRLLPLPRLQHVDLHRGPLERSFGLTSLLLHTAGTHEAGLVIPGLDADEAVRLRDHLVKVGGDDGV